MKKKILIGTTAILISAVAVINVHLYQKQVLSDLTLDNIEALALEAIRDSTKISRQCYGPDGNIHCVCPGSSC